MPTAERTPLLGLVDYRSRKSVNIFTMLITRLTNLLSSRFVLASTQELHAKIHELANRVRDLEDALRYSHAQLSPSSFEQPHPLLTEELLKIKAPLQRELRNDASSAPKEEEPNPDIVDAFGSLSISISGRTKYFGHIANSWVRFPPPLSQLECLSQPGHIAVFPPGWLSLG